MPPEENHTNRAQKRRDCDRVRPLTIAAMAKITAQIASTA